MTAEQMNPRNVTRRTSIDERLPASAVSGAGRRIRWGTVPAALSWCFGGGALIAMLFGVYHTLQMLPLPAGAGPADGIMAIPQWMHDAALTAARNV